LYVKLKLVELCRFTLTAAVVDSITKGQILFLVLVLAARVDE